MRLLRSFCSWLTQEELTPDNLMRRMPNPIKRESDIHPFEPDELDAVFAAARRTRNGPRDEAALLMLADTGLRSSELCGLSMKDVDLTTGMVHVRRGKGDKARRVPLSPTVRKALWCYLRTEQRHPEDRLFMTERGDAFEHNSLRQLCERLGRTTGIHVHPHRFRHTFAVNLLRAGAQQLHLMEYLGHTSITVTARYVKLAAADLQAVHRTCSPVEWARRQSRRCNA
jgi:site-specific recombinase XerD